MPMFSRCVLLLLLACQLNAVPVFASEPPEQARAVDSGATVAPLKADQRKPTRLRKPTPGPLPLTELDDNTIEALSADDAAQLNDLWQAVAYRSPDIMYILGKFCPTMNCGCQKRILRQFLSSNTHQKPTQSNSGSRTVIHQGTLRKLELSESQATMLLNVISGTPQKLVLNYHHYKNSLVSFRQASPLLQRLMPNATATNEPKSPLAVKYNIFSRVPDRNVIEEEVKYYRQSLIDMAGSEAVSKMDASLNPVEYVGDFNPDHHIF